MFDLKSIFQSNLFSLLTWIPGYFSKTFNVYKLAFPDWDYFVFFSSSCGRMYELLKICSPRRSSSVLRYPPSDSFSWFLFCFEDALFIYLFALIYSVIYFLYKLKDSIPMFLSASIWLSLYNFLLTCGKFSMSISLFCLRKYCLLSSKLSL